MAAGVLRGGGQRRRRRASPASPARTAARARSPWASCSSRSDGAAGTRVRRSHLPGRARARPPPGDPGRARDAAARPAGPAAAVSGGRDASARSSRSSSTRRCARRSRELQAARCARRSAAIRLRAARGHPPHPALPRADDSPAQVRGARAAARRRRRARCPPLDARVARRSARFPSAAARASCGSASSCRPRVLDAAAACERAARGRGLRAGGAAVPRPPDPRPLARARARGPRCRRPTSGPTRLDTLVLFRSELRPGGARLHAARALRARGRG